MRLNLKSRILVIATAVMLCAIGAVIASGTQGFAREYEAALQSRSLAIGKSLRIQLERLLQFGIAIDALTGFEEQCLEVVTSYSGIDSAMVVAQDGRILFHSHGAVPAGRLTDPVLLAALNSDRESVLTSTVGDEHWYHSVVPVRNRHAEHVGSIVVRFGADQIDAKLRAMLKSDLAVGVLVLATGLMVLYATLSAFVTKPLAGLIETIVRLRQSRTHLDGRAPIGSGDELGQLGKAFNDLMEDLQRTTVSKTELEAAMSQLQRVSDALFEQKERAEVTLRSIAEAVVTTDARGHIQYMNPVAEALTGWPAEHVIGRPLVQFLTLVDAMTSEPLLRSSDDLLLRMERSHGREVDLIRADGGRIGVAHSAAAMHNQEGEFAGGVLTFRDVTAERSHAKRRSWEASHDVLTGLANRREFTSRVEAAAEAASSAGKHHVVCFIDLDRFKVVNDTCGHAAGDELLQELALLLQSRVRQSDTLARLGGDEFGLLLDGCSVERAELIAADLLAAVRDYRFDRKSKVFSVGLSIGLASLNGDTGAAEVIGMADVACYWAKEQGRDRACVYRTGDSDMAARHREVGWVARINAALEEDRFVLYHQSYLALNPGHHDRRHIEVLLRMIDEEGNLVQPGTFLPAAERYNLMPAIDRWVIKAVFAGYRSLQSDGQPLTCAINLSGTSLNAGGLADFIREQARTYGLPPQSICFEITETAAINNLRQAVEFIKQCKAMGFLFALDDFGTGTSSFGYLKNLPVDFLKIDGSFVKNLERDRIDRAMTETINRVGHLLGIRTVAEYAENPMIIDQLRSIGVDYAQGYGVNRPSPLFAGPPEQASQQAA